MKVIKVDNGHTVFDLALFEIGEKVYFPFDSHRVVQATVTGLENVYQHPDFNQTIWGYVSNEGTTFSIPTKETDRLGWTIYKQSNELPAGAMLVNQFVNIDEPVGHGIQYWVDCPAESELFPTLEEALKYQRPSKRNKKPRLWFKSYRKAIANFIRSTHERNGFGWSNPFKFEDKKVYVRRG